MERDEGQQGQAQGQHNPLWRDVGLGCGLMMVAVVAMSTFLALSAGMFMAAFLLHFNAPHLELPASGVAMLIFIGIQWAFWRTSGLVEGVGNFLSFPFLAF